MQPEKRIKIGACTVTVFANEITTGNGAAIVKNAVLQRTYKDKHGNFLHTSSLPANDIPKAILALTKAYEYILGIASASEETASSMQEAPNGR